MEREITVCTRHTAVISEKAYCSTNCPKLIIHAVIPLDSDRRLPPYFGRANEYKAECHLLDEPIALKWNKRKKYNGYQRCQECHDCESLAKRTTARGR